jgi:hypothetical protein
MKLTNYIVDLGRAVAYYPGLKKITGSTTASILLCQFLYWSDKTDDGWIWKDSDEIEEETGLTYYEQKTAKRVLSELNLVEGEFKPLDHTSRFRVNQDELNNKWEELGGEKLKPIPQKGKRPLTAEEIENEEFFKNNYKEKEYALTEKPSKKGDLVDGFIDTFLNSSGLEKMQIENKIKETMEKRFHINVDSKKWREFIQFVYVRQEKFGEKIDRFIDWSLSNGFDPKYWTPEKMRTLYPQAFVEDNTYKIIENWVEKVPKPKEEVYTPMPKDIGRKRDVT